MIGIVSILIFSIAFSVVLSLICSIIAELAIYYKEKKRRP